MTSLRCWALCPGIPSVNYTIFLCTSPISKIQKMFVSNFHDLLNFVHFFFLHEKFHQLSSQITYASLRSSVPRLAWANEPTRPSRELQYSSEATGRSAPAIPRERIYSWPSQRRGRKKSRSGLPLYQVGHTEKEPVPLENAGAAPPGMAARAAARQAASSSSRKSKRKERIGFYLSNKVRRTGEPAGSPRARVQRKSSSESKCSSTTSCI
jgi:hypothetical protein